MKGFNLRFRTGSKKLFLAIGLLLALAVTPLLQAANAATVRIDSTFSSRLVTGPGSETDFADSTSVQHGNVVQFGILVHNAEDANTGETARNFKVRVTIPDGPGTQTINTETISADNGSSPAPYRATDTTALNSANGQAFTVTGLRQVHVQRNNVAPTNTPTFNWGSPEAVPMDRIQVERSGNSTVMTITPNADGNLGPCFQNALRILFLADITQPVLAPHLSIKKQVRKAGETTFVDSNTAKEGDVLDYQMRFTNDGKAKANNVVIRDSLPTYVTYQPGSAMLKSSDNPTPRPIPDNIVNGGVDVGNYLPGGIGYILIKVKVNKVPQCPITLKNVAVAKSNETPEVWDTTETSLVCQQVTPTPTPTPTPTLTPTPGPSAPPTTPPAPPTDKGELPRTGAATAALLSMIALATSAYLYARERRALKAAVKSSRLR